MREIYTFESKCGADLGLGKVDLLDLEFTKYLSLRDSIKDKDVVSYWLSNRARYWQGNKIIAANNGEESVGTSETPMTVGDINGLETIGVVNQSFPFNKAVSTNELTLLFVFKPSGTTANKYLLGSSNSSTFDSLTVVVTPTGVSTYIGKRGNSVPLRCDDPSVIEATPKLVTVTLSATQGVSIRLNGREVVRDLDRVDPVSVGDFIIGGGGTGTAGRFSGEWGDVALCFNNDLSKPENLNTLKELEKQFLVKYAIGG